MRDKKTIIGITLIVVGTLLLLYKLHILLLPWYIFTWPSLLVLIGLLLIITQEKWEGGVILMTVGGAFLLPKIFDITVRQLWAYWPVLLIILGITLVARHFEEKFKDRQKNVSDGTH